MKAVFLLILLAAAAPAAKLPVRTYTTAEGLPSNTINCVVPDSLGFLWLCTSEGLARFDGDQFKTYGVAEGLPNPYVSAFLETRAGRGAAPERRQYLPRLAGQLRDFRQRERAHVSRSFRRPRFSSEAGPNRISRR